VNETVQELMKTSGRGLNTYRSLPMPVDTPSGRIEAGFLPGFTKVPDYDDVWHSYILTMDCSRVIFVRQGKDAYYDGENSPVFPTILTIYKYILHI